MFRSSLRTFLPLRGVRLQSTTRKKDPLDILLSANAQEIQKATKEARERSGQFNAFSGPLGGANGSLTQLDALDFAKRMPISDKLAGRTMMVHRTDNIFGALHTFDRLVESNSLRVTHQKQKFHRKPNKRRLEKKIANKKRRFDAGIAELFSVVKTAVRRGY